MANFNYNDVKIGGRLTAKPELRTTQSGKEVTTFTVAVNRRGKNENESDFLNVVAWERLAAFVTKYFTKGSSIFVSGEIRTRTWSDSNGQKRYATDILANDICFVDSKNENMETRQPQFQQAPQQQVAPQYQQSQQSQQDAHFETISDEDELPF